MLDRRHLNRTLLAGLASLAMFAPPAAAQSKDPVKIGFAMSLTGGLAGGGKQSLLAIEIWRDEINAKGGLLGRPVQLINYDDQSNPAQIPGIYAKLIDVDKVDLVISSYATNQIAPAMPIVMQKNMVYMALFGTGVNDEFNYNKYFQILPHGTDSKPAPSKGFILTASQMNPKPQTIALVGANAEYAQNVLIGARQNIKEVGGLRIVYDRSYPPTTADFSPIVRAIQAANPDVVFIASYPPDSVGLVRAFNEIGFQPKMIGGGMIGIAFTPIKAQLGPLLNGYVVYDTYVPEPTMKFPGVEEFLKTYQAKASSAGVDPLGYFLPPYAYAQMQILGEAVNKVGSLDQNKIGEYIHKNEFKTIVGDIRFAANGEWDRERVLFVQYQGVQGNDFKQFSQPGKQVIVYPPALKSGNIIYPYADAKK